MKKILNPFVGLDGYCCFGCAPHNPLGLKLECYEDGDEVVATWQPRPEHQGWIDTLHGGIQSALVDEICGWVVMRKLQTAGVTSSLEVRYLHPIKCSAGPLTLRARLAGRRRNLADVEAEIADAAGRVCSRGRCVYYTFPEEVARREMHFCRCRVEGETPDEER